MSKIVLVRANESNTPTAGKSELYIKTTGDLAMRDDTGTETIVGTGVGGGGAVDGEYEGGSSSTVYSVADIDIESGASV